MSQIKEYDFELVVFKFEANCFFTTKSLFHKLQETVTPKNPHYNDICTIEFDNDEYSWVQNAVLQEEQQWTIDAQPGLYGQVLQIHGVSISPEHYHLWERSPWKFSTREDQAAWGY